MFGGTNAKSGSGDSCYGYIMANYPEDSTCQIIRSNDNYTKDAKKVGTSWAFALPEMFNPSKLPIGYQELEFLEATGSQRMTLSLPSSKNVFALKWVAEILIPRGTGDGGLVAQTGGTPYVSFPYHISSSLYPICSTNSGTTGTANNALFNKKFTYELEGDGSGNVTVKANGTTWFTDTRSARNLSSMGLFYDSNGTRSFVTMRVYHLTVYDTDHTTKLIEYIPARRKVDNVYGFYDLVNDVFKTNEGSGNFIAGPSAGDYWSINCTNGTYTGKENITIEQNGQVKNIEVPPSLIVFDKGVDITGGFSETYSDSGARHSKTVTDDSILIDVYGGNASTEFTYTTNNLFDLTNYSSLEIYTDFYRGFTTSGTGLGVDKNTGKYMARSPYPSVYKTGYGSTGQVIQTLDISSLSGEYRIIFGFIFTGNTAACITKIRLV